jgi:Tfp pilus assembly protein PilW
MTNKGFTLLEALLYVAISSIVILGTSFLLISLLQTNVKNQTVAEVEEQGSFVVKLIDQSVRKATGINIPAAQANDVVLSLQMADAAKNPTIFSVTDGTLNITEGAGAAVPLTNSMVTVSGLSFNNYSATSSKGSVKILFTLSYKNSSGRNEFDYSKIFYGTASIR